MEDPSNATGIKTVVTVLTILLGWRVWRFTIRPRLNPDEPKELPYLVPFIGHAAGFFMDFNGAIEKGRKYFERANAAREPFTMTVAGQTIYVATSAEDVGDVWKNTKTISMDPLSIDMYKWIGISEGSRSTMFDPHPDSQYNSRNSKPLTPNQMVIELHRQQESGVRLDELFEKKLNPTMFLHLTHLLTSPPSVLNRSEDSVVVSLHSLCVDLFVTQATENFWGPELLKICPNLVESFLIWEYTSWKFMFQLPGIFAKDMLAAKRTLTGAFTDYYSQPRNKRPDAVFFVSTLEDMLREVGMNEDDMGKFTMLHYWAIVGNVYKMAFWLIAHLVYNPELLEQIRKEIIPSVQGESLDDKYLSEQCPKLDSLIGETLRLTVASSLARVVTHKCVLSGKTLNPGNKIMLPIRELHYDARVWGTNSTDLEPNRFIDNAKLSKSLSYRPWGGGHTLCPGRFLARRSLNAFVAILLAKYDIEVQSTTFPRVDGARPSPGVVPAALGNDVRLKLTCRN